MATKTIQLTRNKKALIDERDFDLIKEHRWQFGSGYAQTSVVVGHINGVNARRTVKMHRLIMNAKKNQEIDHINGDKLNNTRDNLRACSHKQNSQNKHSSLRNTSGYKGVSWLNNRLGKKNWYASIGVDGKRKYLGYFYTAESAAKAYDRAAIKYFGEFACTNLGG